MQVHAVALGDSDGTLPLYTNNENSGEQSLIRLPSSTGFIEVPVRRADEFVRETPALVKIDVEGAEPMVWRGMAARPRVLILEFWPDVLRAFGEDPAGFLTKLVADGYRLSEIEAGGALVPGSADDLLGASLRKGMEINILAELVEP